MANCCGDCAPGERDGEGVSGLVKGMRPLVVGDRTRLERFREVRCDCAC